MVDVGAVDAPPVDDTPGRLGLGLSVARDPHVTYVDWQHLVKRNAKQDPTTFLKQNAILVRALREASWRQQNLKSDATSK